MGVNWALGVQQGNAGEAFANTFKQGMQDRQQNIAKAAMAALVKDPNNQRALEALAQIDPGAAQQFQSQRTEAMKAQLAQHQESILKGAQIFREIKAQHPNVPDDQIYQMTLPALAQAGIDTSQMPKAYDKPYVDNALAIANAFKPQPDHQDPGIIREFDIATQRGLVPPGTTYQQYVTMRNPGMSSPVTIPYGASVSAPGSTDNLPTVSTPEQAHSLPPGTRFRMPDGRIGTVPGGAGGNASGGFPG